MPKKSNYYKGKGTRPANIWQYKDFNELYFSAVPRLLKSADLYLFHNMASGIVKDKPLVVVCDSTRCDKIDISRLGYKKGKWQHLFRSYLGPQKLNELRNIPLQGLTYGFDFFRKNQGNGGCMREIILNRSAYDQPWVEATIFYRTVDMAIKFSADLIMIHHILTNVIPNTKLKKITFVFGNAYLPLMYIPPFLHSVWKLSPKMMKSMEKTNQNGIIAYINYCYNDYYVNATEHLSKEEGGKRMLASGQKLLDHWRKEQTGWRPEPLTYKELNLDGVTTRPKGWYKSL